MKNFTQLFKAVDATTSTNDKVTALQRYFTKEDAKNAVWGLYLLLGKTRKRLLTSRDLQRIFLQMADMPEWLFEESRAHVGDSAETIALLLRDGQIPWMRPAAAQDFVQADSQTPLHVWMETVIAQVKAIKDDPVALQALVSSWWAALSGDEIFVLNKVLTGAFRMGVSSKLVIKAIAAAFDLSEAVVAHRLMGDFEPTAAFFAQLTHPETAAVPPSQPYPFFLASPIDLEKFAADWQVLDQAPQQNRPQRWQAEWKWDGIRAQVIYRAQQCFIWSRGEDLVTHQFPEVAQAACKLPEGTVLDGEIVAWDGCSLNPDGTVRPLDFNDLQKRLGRKRVSAKLMAQNPVHFIAYDLLELAGEDIRTQPLRSRRQALVEVIAAAFERPAGHSCDRTASSTLESQTIGSGVISTAEPLPLENWDALEAWRRQSRRYGAEGLMLKALDSPYLVGRKRGYWWKHKVDPMSLDAVLIYAQAGSGKRANLFTDYTFALWQGSQLVPFAKAYSGLDNAEIEKLDRWIRRHTQEKFGPVRSVEPYHVFEIGFEGISASKRHKSGIAVRFPRILRWRTDKPIAEADTLEAAQTLLAQRDIHALP